MAKKKGDVRGTITLQCGDCRERTYSTSKNRRNDPNRIELRKYCPRCRVVGQHVCEYKYKNEAKQVLRYCRKRQ